MVVTDEAFSKQTHITTEQRIQLRAALYRQHEAVAESKFDRPNTDAFPHVLRPKTKGPAVWSETERSYALCLSTD